MPALITLNDFIDGLRAVSHDLRWENCGEFANQIDSLITRFEESQ